MRNTAHSSIDNIAYYCTSKGVNENLHLYCAWWISRMWGWFRVQKHLCVKKLDFTILALNLAKRQSLAATPGWFSVVRLESRNHRLYSLHYREERERASESAISTFDSIFRINCPVRSVSDIQWDTHAQWPLICGDLINFFSNKKKENLMILFTVTTRY